MSEGVTATDTQQLADRASVGERSELARLADRPPPGSRPPLKTERKPMRWRWRITWAVVFLLIQSFLGTSIYLSQYEPLGLGFHFGTSGVRFQYTETFFAPSERVLDHSFGDTFYMHTTMQNEGPLSVTIQHILDPGDLDIRDRTVYPIKVVLAPHEFWNGRRGKDMEPFRPFTLAPGETREFAIQYRFGRCNVGSGGAALGFASSIPVTYRALWMTRVADVPNDELGLVIRGKKRGDCSL